MDCLAGKKLLIIGGGSANVVIVNAAHEMGVYVICCSRYTKLGNEAKNIADEAWHIDYTHTDEIVEKARAVGINGVFAGTDEQCVLAAARISKKLGTPFYATEAQINLTMNKKIFKDSCITYGVDVPKGFTFFENVTDEEKNNLRYPCIVKPVDNGGRRGITICYSKENIEEAIELAFQKSPSKTILIEDFIEGTEFAAIYTISDGKISLSIINDKYLAYLEDDNQRL